MSRGRATDRMIGYLPAYYCQASKMKAILSAQGQEIDKLYEALDQILDQFFILTATWGLSRWEEMLGLPVNETLPVDERRRRILAKRRGVSQPLLIILQAIEPGLETRFGGDVIPFVLPTKHNADEYDFGPLVPILEIRKPAHKAYSFQLLPPDRFSGYTIYGTRDHGRGKVSLQPEAGTVYTGRWPRWNAPGAVASAAAVIAVFVRTGAAQYGFAGEGVGARSAVAASFVFLPVAGHAPYRFSGVAEAAGSGAVASYVASVSVAAKSATNSFRSCGTFRAGEVI